MSVQETSEGHAAQSSSQQSFPSPVLAFSLPKVLVWMLVLQDKSDIVLLERERESEATAGGGEAAAASARQQPSLLLLALPALLLRSTVFLSSQQSLQCFLFTLQKNKTNTFFSLLFCGHQERNPIGNKVSYVKFCTCVERLWGSVM